MLKLLWVLLPLAANLARTQRLRLRLRHATLQAAFWGCRWFSTFRTTYRTTRFSHFKN